MEGEATSYPRLSYCKVVESVWDYKPDNGVSVEYLYLAPKVGKYCIIFENITSFLALYTRMTRFQIELFVTQEYLLWCVCVCGVGGGGDVNSNSY